MIELRNVSFAYGENVILRNVSFKVADEESVVILGPSGSGKSTILRLILGLVNPFEGQVLIEGQDICKIKEKERRKLRKRMGMVFQDGALFDSMTVGENVGYYLMEHSDLSWDEISEKVERMLGFVGLQSKKVIDSLPETLSGGQRRRVAIGRALLSTNPKVMLYDEPTTGLDPTMTENVLTLISKLQQENSISTVVVTHQIADALSIADRFIALWEGEVAFDGNYEELRDSIDLRVLQFLAPFRISCAQVSKMKFISTS